LGTSRERADYHINTNILERCFRENDTFISRCCDVFWKVRASLYTKRHICQDHLGMTWKEGVYLYKQRLSLIAINRLVGIC